MLRGILLIALSMTFVGPAMAMEWKKVLKVEGVWALRDRKCYPSQKASLGEKLMARITRRINMPYLPELMIISPDGVIQKYDNDGNLTTSGEVALVDGKYLSVRAPGVPAKLTIKDHSMSGFNLTHTNDPKCDGIVQSLYSRVKVLKNYESML